MPQYKPHQPGEAPAKPDRDHNGVQRFAGRPQRDPCPTGMVRDPANGECRPEGEQQ
ncbi:hypothetical protein [Streptomyces sp. GbtcB6]|uniref:hypothetical protein n=1 Tax=Streptomyces sp. GbtcB6 TaxID=2824751 RepID=UPI001C30455C|nr:hypothetical protein [Streptomyces sp. GbtcB6]